MRKPILLLIAALLLGGVPARADWELGWSNGFSVKDPDKGHSLKFGGRIQSDFAWFSEDDELAPLGFEDGAEFRRARLFFSGTLYDRVVFKAQYDFAGGGAEPKDLYLGLTNLGAVDTILVGHFKEPFSLEEITSSKYVTFMERALPIEAFSPSRNVGLMAGTGGDRYSWHVGAFYEADDSADSVSDEVNLTGRVTFAPIYSDEDGAYRALHLGLSATDRSPTDDVLRYRSRPESHLSPRVVDTRAFASDNATIYDVEAALVTGPFSLQGEFIQSSADRIGAGDPDFDGFYVYGSYFLTAGDHRSYEPDAGAFGRTRPSNPWGGEDGGTGAWEIALRYSTLDLADAGINGGEVDDLTFALNWYPYANVRFMFNYVLSDVDGVGEVDVVQTRFQIDF